MSSILATTVAELLRSVQDGEVEGDESLKTCGAKFSGGDLDFCFEECERSLKVC